jgi:dihydroorotate dehydrogenase electron transfer subunit
MASRMPIISRITGIEEHSPSVRTFHFDTPIPFTPGQFVMVWIPGVDEIPMALSSGSSITVQRVGDATAALFQRVPGDRIGIRGPFGNGFSVHGRTLVIAGGIGAAPMLPLVRQTIIETVFLGARTAGDLLFTREFSGAGTFRIATDDGSAGHPGYVVELMDTIDIHAYDTICVCGPERMMHSVLLRLARDGVADRGQFSLHRYMKCGVGVCGSCCIDPGGLRVCRDGPVFSGDILLESEFGHYARDASGKRIRIP